MKSVTLLFIALAHLVFNSSSIASGHPSLILTSNAVKELRARYGKLPLLDKSIDMAIREVDQRISEGIIVPLPKDLAGGFTHEQHKINFFTLQKAGVLFQITKDKKYAQYIKDVLLEYVKIYSTFDHHPSNRSYAPGKFFWQCLNDANWLVYVSQAYDCIYNWLDINERQKIEDELLRPYADFISKDNPQFFNRIHNHSTWGNAAVGMVGLVIGDEELVQRALYGLPKSSSSSDEVDNDGGLISLPEQNESGFFAQIDHSFSPDGYYTEGPYYQRYAMYPFLIFAQGLSNVKRNIFIWNYRDGILLKAVYALIQQTNKAGEFFPLNDAQKGMSLASRELVNAVSMAHHFGSQDPTLLSIIEKQGRVPLNDAGLSAALAIEEGHAEPFSYKSMELKDGAKGDEGAIGILRDEEITLVMKYAKHGMGHGHFDRLSFLLYDAEDEIIQDYGSARWVNIEHKDGGGYLKENKTWAKQTIAHNTLVINKTSQFNGDIQSADLTSGAPYYFKTGSTVNIVSAKELNAYNGVALQRTMATIRLDELERPLILDLFSVQAPENTRYDLPLYYVGELMSTNQSIRSGSTLKPLGETFGYQHLWGEGSITVDSALFKMTWFNGKSFYSITSAAQQKDSVILTRIGANDSNFNLRRDPGLVYRRQAGATHFVSTYELHGHYKFSDEIPINSFSQVEKLEVIHESEEYVAVEIGFKSGSVYQFSFSLKDSNEESTHSIHTTRGELSWKGVYHLNKLVNKQK